MTRLIICLTPIGLMLSLLLPGPAQGQETPQRWFRVELLIFTHESGDSGTEVWEATPELSYPVASRFLIDPDRVSANAREYGGKSAVDEYGRQIITIRPDQDDIAAVEPNAQNELGLETEIEAALVPRAFVTLPAEELALRGKAAYMERSGRYRTLFHEAWLEPVADEDRALPIVVDRSGDTGEWPRLQGSVKFFLSRYLHLETNLWLNTHGEYLSGGWQMPAPPLGPPSLIIEEPMSLDSSAGADGDGIRWRETDLQNAYDPNSAAIDPNEVQEQQYPYRHAVLLQQRRRMRSEEIHYIDHPLLGIVVTLTPMTPEELEAQALQQGELVTDW